MSTPFQNRLVGTIIVAAVAIIFLPDLLDGDKKKHNAEFENIPQAPKIELNTQIQPFPADKLIAVKPPADEVVEGEQDTVLEFSPEVQLTNLASETASPSIETNDGTVKVNTLPKPSVKEEIPASITKPISASLPTKINVKESWVIQLGSFRHEKNVLALIEKLKYHGYVTYTKPIKTKNGILTKVFVGPDINKASLESKIGPLKLLTNVQGKVTRFYPTKS